MSSGQSQFHTRLLRRQGKHILWKILESTHEVAIKLPNGDLRSPRALRKLILDAIHPSCIQKLRVKLAARVFTTEIQDFILLNKERIANLSHVRISDVEQTVEFMSKVNELFNMLFIYDDPEVSRCLVCILDQNLVAAMHERNGLQGCS